jgi:hypothetical protein
MASRRVYQRVGGGGNNSIEYDDIKDNENDKNFDGNGDDNEQD